MTFLDRLYRHPGEYLLRWYVFFRSIHTFLGGGTGCLGIRNLQLGGIVRWVRSFVLFCQGQGVFVAKLIGSMWLVYNLPANFPYKSTIYVYRVNIKYSNFDGSHMAKVLFGPGPPSSTNQKTSVDSSPLKGPRLRTGWTSTNRTQLVGKAARDFCRRVQTGVEPKIMGKFPNHPFF